LVGSTALILLADETQPLLTVGTNLHLILKTHVVLDVLARHADIVGDLVDLIALFGSL
jgi:hypothetical protein